MSWIAILIIAAILLEARILYAYRWIQQNMPEQALWVVLGSKVIKLLIAAVAIIGVNALATDIDIKDFCIAVIITYLVMLVIETIFFLKKKK